MLVHALRAGRRRPAFFLGGELPGRRRRRRAGERRLGRGRVGGRRGRRVRRQLPRAARPRSRWSPTSSSITTRAGARAPSCSARSRAFAGAAAGLGAARRPALDPLAAGRRRAALRRRAPGPPTLRCAVPGPPQRAQRPGGACRARARRRSTLDAAAAGARPTSRACVRRQQRKGSRDGAEIYDDYAHHPTEVARDARGAARARAAAADRGLPAAPVLAHEGARGALRRRARRRRRGRRARCLRGPRAAGGRARRGQRARRRPRGRRPRRRAPGAVAARRRQRASACSARGSARATCW